jgi:hypothetical protein
MPLSSGEGRLYGLYYVELGTGPVYSRLIAWRDL